MTTGGFGGEEIRRESSWRYPLAIFIATLILCAIFLYYYVGPSVDELGGNVPSPAISEESVALSVGSFGFAVPANYTVYPRDRRGGARDEVSLYAMWPTMTGFTPTRRDEFLENAADTRRIDLSIALRTSPFTETERIETLYMPRTVDQRGERTAFDLIRYSFRAPRADFEVNTYQDTELFIGEDARGEVAALFCFLDREDIVSPECWRETELRRDVTLVYRFKREYLPEWRAIDAEILRFVEGLAG